MTQDEMENKITYLERLVESLVIARDGIQELEGDYIFLYDRADQHLKNRAKSIRYKLSREKEKYELEQQMVLLKQRIEALS